MSAACHEQSGSEGGGTSGTGREYGDVLTCDERCYVDTWTSLLRMEFAAEQGPIDDMDSDVAMEDLVREGHVHSSCGSRICGGCLRLRGALDR